MCGIFGVSVNRESGIKKGTYKRILRSLFLLSESRGKEASGFAFNAGSNIRVFKTPFPSSYLVRSKLYGREVERLLNKVDAPFYTAIGHSRLVTDGHEQDNFNNQPVIKKDMVAIHNGIIVNRIELWRKYRDEKKETKLDSELIPALLGRFQEEEGKIFPLRHALHHLYTEIEGLASFAMLFGHLNNLLLATNNGSIYYCLSKDKKAFVFGSERFILSKLIEENKLENFFSKEDITQLQANTSGLLNLQTSAFEVQPVNKEPETEYKELNVVDRETDLQLIDEKIPAKEVIINKSIGERDVRVPQVFMNLVRERKRTIESLKRCTCCILPSTFPFIEFDTKGVCNYCNNSHKLNFKGADKFREICDKNRTKNGKPDCLVPLSGGRDSSYLLHYIKTELNMNPIAFSYDWGMITDLARRNQARMCGKLGVEHILISADIRKKRSNIRKNVLAWLKRPRLGTVPLFMAGDKQFLHYTNLLMEQNNLELAVVGENMLETTRFKTGFCGIKPNFEGERTFSLSKADKVKMALYYAKEFALNPSYINSSIIDTLKAFGSYYVITHQAINLFDYLPWNEEEIDHLLINEYKWETDPGTPTTWRIGDGTAAFYNYIYYFVAGFSENDTFRSNQVREGLIDRDKALQRAHEENNPRWESLQWYCDTINIDFEKTIGIINSISTLY